MCIYIYIKGHSKILWFKKIYFRIVFLKFSSVILCIVWNWLNLFWSCKTICFEDNYYDGKSNSIQGWIGVWHRNFWKLRNANHVKFKNVWCLQRSMFWNLLIQQLIIAWMPLAYFKVGPLLSLCGDKDEWPVSLSVRLVHFKSSLEWI